MSFLKVIRQFGLVAVIIIGKKFEKNLFQKTQNFNIQHVVATNLLLGELLHPKGKNYC